MATRANISADIKKSKTELNNIHNQLLILKEEFLLEPTEEQIVSAKAKILEFRDKVNAIVTQVGEWEKAGMKDLPKIEKALICNDIIFDLNNFINEKLNPSDLSQIQSTSGLGGEQVRPSAPSGSIDSLPPHYVQPTATTVSTPAYAIGRIVNPVNITQTTTSFASPQISYSITGTSQAPIPDQRNLKVFNMKWADKVPKFDGSFDKFHSFIEMFNQFVHLTNAENSGKLLILREKLDQNSLNLIAGIRESEYNVAYQILINYYTESHPLQRTLKEKVEKLPEVKLWYETDKMRQNLAVIKDAFTVLNSSESNKSFLETDFFYIIASKFPRDAVKDTVNRFRQRISVQQYIEELTSYITLNEHQTIILSKTDYMMNRNKPKYQFRPRFIPTPVFRRPVPNRNFQPQITYPNMQQLRITEEPQPTTSKAVVPYNPRSNNNNFRNKTPQQFKPKRDGIRTCFFCNGNHLPSLCYRVSIPEKIKILNSKKRCIKCFSAFHMLNDCPQEFACRLCNGNHNTSLCDIKPVPRINRTVISRLPKINITLNNHKREALLDSGASHSFISEIVCKEIGVTPEPCQIIVKQAVSDVRIYGMVSLDVKIGSIERRHPFYVLPNVQDIIIGIDIIDCFLIQINPGGQIFQLLNSGKIKG
ncbi:hypothetical protein BLA29_001094 [Euroglyphus maynei]|uniref:Peptidase A2 domain-containing protein n=1 Tax=Euroglyphus maynei TaxID=6958 RepID=A0A1Y3BJT5_EURMA|nr:hypothetical protein BLA29_001094 [Euroglyphus maynei]